MTNEELISRIESVQQELAAISREYACSVETTYNLAKTLIAGEHYHALSPVLDSMPVGLFKERIASLKDVIAKTISEVKGEPTVADVQ